LRPHVAVQKFFNKSNNSWFLCFSSIRCFHPLISSHWMNY